jgi:Ca-activated chloride channel homolog
MRTVFALLVAFLLTLGSRAQETQAEPGPAGPVPKQTSEEQAQKPAPVERRAAKPSTAPVEPVAGPLGKQGAAGQSVPQPVNRGGEVGTIKVQSRLINVALNVVDGHGTPVGGFEKKDFQLFEDGKPQAIAVFEREAKSPLSIVLAIDESGTVETSERLERQAAKHFVQAILRQQDELDLMDFSDTVREVVPFTNQPKRIEQGLGQLQRGDETALYNAIYLASDRLGSRADSANQRRVLVVISDGGDSIQGGEKYEQAVEAAQRAGAMIYAIIIVPVAADAGRNTGGEHALIQMTEDTGGKYYYVEDPADLEPAFRHVSDDLRTQYLLGYYSPQEGAEFRRISVRLADGKGVGYSLRYRTGYYADRR